MRAASRRIDGANAKDPRNELDGGEEKPKEWLYGRRMIAWLDRLEPAASTELRLAVRAQHLERWRLPRSEYPEGRAGYLAWRRACAAMHAKRAGEILADEGYPASTIDRVGDLIQKRGRLRLDPESQALEDVACLVFVEHYLKGFAGEHPRERMVSVLAKTWRKMSARGRAAAADIELPTELAALVASVAAEEGE
ncbi:MAG: DUF4202 domain-containing protein [Acidobacteriota bacterium]|nr:DUF4202 domain-containing protein [Acidobacteriota bacterium]